MKRGIIVGLIVGILIGSLIPRQVRVREKEYIIRTVRDTVRVIRPVPVAVPETVRVETVRLSTPGGDSVAAQVPVTSVVYAGDGYRARISGFRPKLDSLVFERSIVTNLTKPKRWAVGVQAGIAATPKGMQPFIGVGITYKLWDF